MSDDVSLQRTDGGFLGALRTVAFIAVLIGATGSVGFTLRAGQRNPSSLLIALFVLWVLSPFVGMAFASFVSKDWSVLTRTTLYSMILVFSLASLAVYGQVAFGPPKSKTAFAFVVIPPLSWLIMALAVSAAAFISRRRSRARGLV